MRSWPSPFIPDIPGHGPAVRVHDTARGELVTLEPGPVAGLYVCGITPYDATHMGHAATYVTFDVLGRALRDAGHEVRYVQNVTDVDDPLLARAVRDGVDWIHLADRETSLFREDMTALSVIAPDHYLGVTESIDLIVADVEALLANGMAYRIDTPDAVEADGRDVYLDISQRPGFGDLSGLTREEMLPIFGERGGDPERAGKRDPLDPLLWRAERADEPSWDGATLGRGRPGWHIECTALAVRYLGMPFTVQGGGTDLVFPHHEMSAVQGCALTGTRPFAQVYMHQAMVAFEGEKMSKSKGNLVLVSALRAAGVDPMVIRLALLDHHYR
ncbi:MAG TPA: cysteine--1-D-myo-inosityl 2-amino-2-deoxy-alpha-D-glucopyranoside ligase, partial [Dermatophilaceae bacterium]|nr:cysteine--1-D-myo-inosityl 2-amino-2-deoxy-alpha-D-glucopyranoside ligase [Dermatophilaceae bacterium]